MIADTIHAVEGSMSDFEELTFLTLYIRRMEDHVEVHHNVSRSVEACTWV